MKLLKTSCIAAGSGLLAFSALAGTQAGNLELEGAASLQWQAEHENNGARSSSQALYQGQIGVGYFLTDALEIKLNGVFQGNDGRVGGAWSQNYDIFVLAGVDYHFFTKERIVPYVGIYGGGAFGNSTFSGGGSSTDIGGVVDIHGGMKQFLGERTSIDYRISYQYISQSRSNNSGGGGPNPPDDNITINALVFSIGVTYQF